MEFSVLNKRTIQCIMTEEEIADYGMDKASIYQNDERVKEFFQRIMQKAELETGFVKERGDVAVHAAFLSDESLEITFFVNERKEKIPLQDTRKEKRDKTKENVSELTIAVLKVRKLMDMIEFCKKAPQGLQSCLYKHKNVYFMFIDIKDYGMYQTAVLVNLADEYMDAICYTKGIEVYLKEHGKCMVSEHAVDVLRNL